MADNQALDVDAIAAVAKSGMAQGGAFFDGDMCTSIRQLTTALRAAQRERFVVDDVAVERGSNAFHATLDKIESENERRMGRIGYAVNDGDISAAIRAALTAARGGG